MPKHKNNVPSGQKMRMMGKGISKGLPEGWGFALIVFPFFDPGISNYISNGTREDMIKALRETADRLEKRQDFPTPENN